MFNKMVEEILENHEKRIKELENKQEVIASQGKKIEKTIKTVKEETKKQNKRIKLGAYTRDPPKDSKWWKKKK